MPRRRAASARMATLAALASLAAACSDRPRPPPLPSGEAFRINPARWLEPVASAPTAAPGASAEAMR